MILIHATLPNSNRPIVLNAHHIEMFRSVDSNDGPEFQLGKTLIFVNGDNSPFVVKESLNQILAQFPE